MISWYFITKVKLIIAFKRIGLVQLFSKLIVIKGFIRWSKFIYNMWQVYQYAHGKLKLTKDLKTAESHLRVSLIDQ